MNMRYADLILVNVLLWKGREDAAPRPGMALAVAGDRIIRIGCASDVLELRGPETEVIDLRSLLLVPGFRDAHIHPMIGAIDLVECRLSGPAEEASYL
ncbi:amidohydrolase, partial [Candidatus Ozemobacteraceae bacterium]|nr:amidohydrolase [Candidatus Ozemobacteraceae bacterium]